MNSCSYTWLTDRSFLSIASLGVPASLALGYVIAMQFFYFMVFTNTHCYTSSFGAVYMICAVGVYV